MGNMNPVGHTYSYLVDAPDDKRAQLTILDRDKVSRESLGKRVSDSESMYDEVGRQFLENAKWWQEGINHPNIAVLHKFGINTQFGRYYFITREYISDLPMFEAASGLAPIEMIRLFIPVLEALSYLHVEKKVLHLNIKSKRIRVKMKEAGGYIVKFTDCGYAVPITEGARRKDSQCGTPGYMSPEVALGKGHLIGTTSDLYSLGILLYYCITCKLPFPGRLAAGTNLERLAQIVGDEDLPLPPATINKARPGALSDIVMNLIQKGPSDRAYKGAKELIEALQNVSPDTCEGTPEQGEISVV